MLGPSPCCLPQLNSRQAGECISVCTAGAQAEGGVQAPLIRQPGWEQVIHLASASLCPSYLAQLTLGVRWGGGCLPWLPQLAVPQLPSCHALALPGTPGLRSGAASSGCQASFPISEGELPTLRRLLEPVPRKPGLRAAHPPTPRVTSDPQQVPM